MSKKLSESESTENSEMQKTRTLLNRAINLSNINQNILKTQYAVRGAVVIRADKFNHELKAGKKLPFDEIVFCNIGNPQQLGQKPITFTRRVLSLVLSPELLNEKLPFPEDVYERARTILSELDGNSGAYTHSQGLLSVRKNVAEFIKRRDGFESDPNRIFLTDGASPGVQTILRTLIRGKQDGIMIPIPQYPLYSATIELCGGTQVPYYLKESENWGLNIQDLEKSYEKATNEGICVKALVIINPGNPTGQVLTKENMKEIIDFCVRRNVVLLADEVYQENIYGDTPFNSFKKVSHEMGGKYADIEMFSFHSVSKGFFGECGRRGGYYEISKGVSDEIVEQLYKLASINLCPNVDGQLTVDTMVNPPKPGEPSYELYKEERDAIINSLKRRANLLIEKFNKLPGISCNQAEGAMYAFPKITLPPKAIQAAREKNMEPDLFYVLELLDNTGICVIPGCGFGQEEGTYHFRTTFLPPEEKLQKVMEKFEEFHTNFMNKYK